MQGESNDIHIENHLLSDLRNGSIQAFERLFNHYWQELYVLAYRRLRDQSEAEDMVQEIFAGIWERHEQLNITTSLGSYLRTALKYRIIKWASRADLHKEVVAHLLSHMEAMEDTILDAMAAGDLHKTISQVVDTFPENMRRIFLLRVENYTVAEIAAALGLATQTVKNNNAEALRRLRIVLAEKHPDIHKSFYAVLVLFIQN